MHLKTKFNFGDKVFSVKYSAHRAWKVCGFCGGTGVVLGQDRTSRCCPNCRGDKGKRIYGAMEWKVDKRLTVGEVRVVKRCAYIPEMPSLFDNFSSRDAFYEERYMCQETGIGSGILYPVEKLFRTKEEAERFCEEKNKEKGDENV